MSPRFPRLLHAGSGYAFLFQTASVACVLLLLSSGFARDRASSVVPGNDGAIRKLISQWADAYKRFDAKRLASLEAPDVEVVDRFGELHQPSGRHANEKLWSAAFEMVAMNTTPPRVAIDRIRFLRSDVALVQVSWTFAEGILLADGKRIPPFSELDTYVVVKSQSDWLVAAHYMQEKKP